MSLFRIGSPVIFEAKGRIVPVGECGRVTAIRDADDGTWVTARFPSGEYSMKDGGDIFDFDTVELLNDIDDLKKKIQGE